MVDPDMGVSEDSYVENGEDEEVDFPDMNHLKAFGMEPGRSVDDWESYVSIKSESSGDSITECKRIGNI